MRIGILGAGMMTRALARRLASAGHEVKIGGRTVSKAVDIAQAIGPRASAGTLADAADFGEVLLLAVHYSGVDATLAAAGASEGRLRGKVLIDCTNPVEVEAFTLVTKGRSIAEDIQRVTGARVVKAFNLSHAKVWESGPAVFGGQPLAVLMSSDDPEATAVVSRLVTDLAYEPVDVGPLHLAQHIEAMAAIVIALLVNGRDPLTVFNLIDPAKALPSARLV
jgi:hypothetical protein